MIRLFRTIGARCFNSVGVIITLEDTNDTKSTHLGVVGFEESTGFSGTKFGTGEARPKRVPFTRENNPRGDTSPEMKRATRD